MKKGLIFGLIAVLSAGLLLIGCGQGTDGGTSYVNLGGRLVDYEVTVNEAELIAALENPDYEVIGVTTDLTLATVREIPAGKTVVLYAELTPDGVANGGLEVKGTLIVEGAGILHAAVATPVRVTDGFLEVNNGTLDLDSVVAIHGSNIEVQILGTSKAHFNGGALSISNAVATLEDITTAFSWVPKGTLTIAEVTQPVKPSQLALLPATATRRLTVTAPLPVDPESLDTAETITVPAGMTFESADPLTNLKTLSVAGDLTLSAATLSRVENLTVSGALASLTAASATYERVTTLTVGSDLTITPPLDALESLTVNAGTFTATAAAIGSAEAGLAIAVAEDASAIVGSITKLKTSTIRGELTANGFVPDTDAVLTAAAGAVINDIAFPAATAITALTANNVTIGDYTVPEDEVLDIGAGKTLIIPTTKILTFAVHADASGTGWIVARGDTNGGTITINGTAGYITDPTGVVGDDFAVALAAMKAITASLTAVDLKTTYNPDGTDTQYPGIGSIAVTAVTATAVKDGADGTGTDLDFGDTEFTVALTAPTVTGKDSVGFTGAITVTLDGGALKVADAGYDGSTPKNVILNVPSAADLKLKNSGLISPIAVPAFNIGLTTSRT